MNKETRLLRSAPLLMALAAFWVLPALVQADTAREMLDQAKEVNDAREPKDVTQSFRMILFDSRGGERVRDLVAYSKDYGDGEKKAITFFRSPAEVKGVGFLAWSHRGRDDDQWLYLPALKRVRQITANTRRQSFQGSDFSYEDLELFEDIRDWTEKDASAKLVKDSGEADGVACVVIELTPKGKDIEYGRFILWLHREDSTFRKIEFYAVKDGALVKTLDLSAFQTIDGVPTPHRLEMASVKKRTKTVMEISEVKYNQDLADEMFTQRYLERGRVP